MDRPCLADRALGGPKDGDHGFHHGLEEGAIVRRQPACEDGTAVSRCTLRSSTVE